MAARSDVKQYLAYWLQLGKKIFIKGQPQAVGLDRVINHEQYDEVFEQLWLNVSGKQANLAYLEGTDETIQDLLSTEWQIVDCPRCELRLPCLDLGPRQFNSCPCEGLNNWPNYDTLQPRSPVITKTHLSSICDRLETAEHNQ